MDREKKPFFHITFGHILLMASWLAAAFTTYGTLASQQATNSKRIELLETIVNNLIEAKSELKTDINWIKRELNKDEKH